MKRRVVAIGDLHGDVHRLTRILERQGILREGTRTWSPGAQSVDLVLLGDYVDWRGETLEGDKRVWERGIADLLDFIQSLHGQVSDLRGKSQTFTSQFYPLIGNHDKLMLDAYKYLITMPDAKVKPLASFYEDYKRVQKTLPRPRPKSAEEVAYVRLIRWLSQGGGSTIKSHGGLDSWMVRMKGGLASFLDQNLRLGVVINNRQYSHSVPDDPAYWRPTSEVDRLSGDQKDAAVEEYVWGRRIWGFDQNTGQKVNRPDQGTVDKMVAALKVQSVVVGHSLMPSLWPVKAYEGRVVNIDLHGNPLSEPWLESYDDGVRV